jgi:hypothetical protein
MASRFPPATVPYGGERLLTFVNYYVKCTFMLLWRERLARGLGTTSQVSGAAGTYQVAFKLSRIAIAWSA